MDMNVRIVPRHISHHGEHSGYDRLFEHMGIKPARNTLTAWLGRQFPRKLAWRLWSLRPQQTQAAGMEAELGAAPWVAFGRGRLCHFIYGEDTYFFTPLWKNSKNRCIATFHYPPDRLVERVNPGPVRSLDAVVVVGTNQIDYFARFLPAEKIFYCPHHVDTEFFRPDPEPSLQGGPRLICVGQVFRNHDTVLTVHRQLRAEGIDVTTCVIGPRTLGNHPLSREPGVELYSGLSDEELLAQLRKASIGFLPLSDATANNSLLEMMACGLPVLTSDVGGVKDYVHRSAVRMLAKEAGSQFVSNIKELLSDAPLRATEGKRNREHVVKHFSLPVVKERMTEIYRTVMAR